ncbi:MAG: tyrosine-type recombinase/integrase [Bryobacteraceae bacterium]
MRPVASPERLAVRSSPRAIKSCLVRNRAAGFARSTRIGTPLEPRNVERVFRNILREADLPRIRIHDLRHPAATLLLAQGVHPRVVMELLGHSQIAVTMNTCTHVLPSLRKDAAEKMNALLAPVATRSGSSPGSVLPSYL